MAFSATTFKSFAAQAGRGDLRALETLLRDMGDHIDGLSPAELSLLDGVTAGTMTASKVLSVDSGGVLDTATVTTLKSGVTAATTASNISNTGITTINSTSTASYAMDAPVAGVSKVLTMTSTNTDAQIVTLASGTFDGTNQIATFNAIRETLTLEGLTTAAYAIVGNVGAVALSTS